MRTNVLSLVRLMLVTDEALVGSRDLVALARAAERGGATSVQLRLKSAPARVQAEAARALIAVLAIPLLVNDRPDVALAVGAAGVHLGPGDLAPRLARRVLPEAMVIGASVGSPAEALTATEADYWGVGPWGVTETKDDAGAALGPTGFAAVARESGGRPCIAIGSVAPGDVPAILRAGGSGVAAVSGILGSPGTTADAVAEATLRYARALGLR